MEYECRKNKYNKLQDKVIYSLYTDKQNKFKGYQIYLKEDGIRLRYPIRDNPLNYLFVVSNVSKILKKQIVTADDLNAFKEKYHSIIHNRIFYHHDFLQSELINRIDYKFDYRCKDEYEKENLLTILGKARKKRYSAIKKKYKSTGTTETIYFNARNYKINIYDKELEASSKGYYSDNYKNVIRYELQLLTGTLNTYEKKYGLKRIVDNYWDMRNYFFKEFLVPIFYQGNYYSNNIISRLLKNANNKELLYSKILEVQNSDSLGKIYSYNQLKQLQGLRINPLQNSINLQNPLNFIYKKYA